MDLPVDVLIPPKGLSREIGLLVAGLEDVRAQTIELIADLSVEELSARPFEQAPQIGALLLHLAKNEYWWIQVAYADRDDTGDERRKFFLEEEALDTDFTTQLLTADDCIALLNAAHQLTLSTLAGADDSELEIFFANPKPTPEYKSTLRWIIHHVIDHEAHHKGQIAMLKRLVRSNS